nr:phosphotransferase [Ectobacillus panaciterrae]
MQKRLNIAMIQQWISQFTVSFQVQSFRAASHGQENIVLMLTDAHQSMYVLKLYSIARSHFTASYIERIMERETAFVMFLREKGVPVPALYQTKDGGFFIKEIQNEHFLFVTLSEYIKGKALFYTLPHMQAMAALQAKMHKAAVSFAAENFYKEPDDQYSMLAYRMKQRKPITAKKFPNALYSQLEYVYREVQPELSSFYKKHEKFLIHCDVKFDNVLMNGTRIGALLDFGDVRYSVMHEDLGASIFYMCDYFHNRKLEFGRFLSVYLRSYEKESGRRLSNLDKTIILYYAADRFLIWNLFYLAEDQHNEKEIMYQEKMAKKHMRLIEKLFMFFGKELYWQG